MAAKVNLRDKLASFSETWTTKLVGELNGQHVKLAKTEGEFVWHTHENEDELFFVVEGQLDIHLPDDEVVSLEPGEFLVVPRGVPHKPVGDASVLLFEPASTRNTGEVDNDHTIEPDDIERI